MNNIINYKVSKMIDDTLIEQALNDLRAILANITVDNIGLLEQYQAVITERMNELKEDLENDNQAEENTTESPAEENTSEESASE